MNNGFDIENAIYDNIDQLIICKICRKIVIQPVQCGNCESIYCKNCAINSSKNNSSCVYCNDYYEEKLVEEENLVNLIKVKIICQICRNVFDYNSAIDHCLKCLPKHTKGKSQEWNNNYPIRYPENNTNQREIEITLLGKDTNNKCFYFQQEIGFSLFSKLQKVYIKENNILRDENEKLKKEMLRFRQFENTIKKTFKENLELKEILQEIRDINIRLIGEIEEKKSENTKLKIEIERKNQVIDENQITINKLDTSLKIVISNQEINQTKIDSITQENQHFSNYISLIKTILLCFNCNKYESVPDFLNNVCKKCKQNYCSDCIIKCEGCDKLFCLKHTFGCDVCKLRKCREEMLKCLGCNRTQCRKCLSEVCVNCDWRFQNVYDENIALENNDHICTVKTSNECVNKICYGNKIFGLGIHKWEVKIKFPLCQFIDFGLIKLPSNNINDIGNFSDCEKISIKSLSYFTANNYCNIPLVLSIDMVSKVFSFQVNECKVERKVEGDYFLPYFQLCNNSISLKHYFIINKI